MSIYSFILLVSIIYILRTLLFKIGNKLEDKKIKKNISESFTPFVSVIVPSRNEEENIANCLLSLHSSNYPIDKFEIIVVDDRSSDNTYSIIVELSKTIKNLKIVKLENDSQKGNLLGKPGAVQAGIDVSKGEIILMTDADCILSAKWIRKLVTEYSDENNLMVCSSTTSHTKTNFDVIQAIDWLYSSSLARGGVGLNKIVGCFGNNFSIRKSTFDQLGGYRKIQFTVTEDFSLMKAVDEIENKDANKNDNAGNIRYLCDVDALVVTNACKSFGEYIKQKKRWALGGKALGWKAFVLVLTSLSLWTGIFSSIYYNKPHLSIFLVFTRLICDMWILIPVLNTLNYRKLKSWLIPSIIYFMMIELVIPFTLFSNKIEWKNQVFKGS